MEDEASVHLVGLRNQRLRAAYFTIIRPSVVEFCGVFFLVFVIHCSGAIIVQTTEQPRFAGPALHQTESLVAVFAFIGVFSFTRPISGGHLNPVITVISLVTGATAPLVGLCYVLAQIIGSILGALCVKIVADVKMSMFLKPSLGAGHLIFAEMMGSLIVILAYLTLVTKSKGNVAILGIGFGYAGALLAVWLCYVGFDVLLSSPWPYLFLIVFKHRRNKILCIWSYPPRWKALWYLRKRHTATLGFLNPVLNFGIAVAVGEWDKHYVYWVGTALGGFLATLLHRLIFASPDQLWLPRPHNMPERMTRGSV